MTRQLDMSGFREVFVIHIPLANLETLWTDSEGNLAMVNDGSITS